VKTKELFFFFFFFFFFSVFFLRGGGSILPFLLFWAFGVFGGSNTFPPLLSVLLMWSLLKGALLARSLARFARCLAPVLSSATRLLQIRTPQDEFLVSIPCTSVVVVVVFVFFFPSDASGAEGTKKDLVR